MAEQNPNPPAAKAKADLVAEIGTLTYPRACAHFGKEKALEVMHKVAEIGGHGMFEDVHFMSPVFGGLQMPSPEVVGKPDKAEYDKMPEGEFWYQSALEEYEAAKADAIVKRAAINDFYLSQK